jgi:NTP pyrophosphatase (non-canonical NTP hydrolase)
MSDHTYHRPNQLQIIEEQRMTMYLNEYQLKAAETAEYDDPMYPIASLMVESAELADIFIKPWLRGDLDDPDRMEVIAEAGDVLWNLANLLKDMDITLSEVAEYNVKKLKSRKERGVLSGNGGNR